MFPETGYQLTLLEPNISRFFVDRPVFASALSIVIFVLGLLAIPQLPISEYPEVVPPGPIVPGDGVLPDA